MATTITAVDEVVRLAQIGDHERLKLATYRAVVSAIKELWANDRHNDNDDEVSAASIPLKLLLSWGTPEQRFQVFFGFVNDTAFFERTRTSIDRTDGQTASTTTTEVPAATAPATAAGIAAENYGKVDVDTAIALAIARESAGHLLLYHSPWAGRRTIVHLTAAFGSPWLFEQLVQLACSLGDACYMKAFYELDGRDRTPMATAADRATDDREGVVIVDRLLDLPGVEIDKTTSYFAMTSKSENLLLCFIRKRPRCVTDGWIKRAIRGAQSSPGLFDELIHQRGRHGWGDNLLFLAIEQLNLFAVKKLLKEHPDLAVKRKAIMTDGADPEESVPRREKPALYFVSRIKDAVLSANMREVIAPCVVRNAVVQHQLEGEEASAGRSLAEELRALLGDLPGQRKEISLDLGGFKHSKRSVEHFLDMISAPSPSQPATAAKTKKQPLLNVEFEKTLRFVDIAVPDLPRQQQESQGILIRTEAERILDWLHCTKDVRGIYELRIRDSLYIPHCEAVISACLRRFDVEVLDWMRADMSLRPVVDTCRNLKEVTLYASKWSSLQAWICEESMESLWSCFLKIKKVRIVILQDLIGKELAKLYEDETKERLDRLLGITVPPPVEAPELAAADDGGDDTPAAPTPLPPSLGVAREETPSNVRGDHASAATPPPTPPPSNLERGVFHVERGAWPLAQSAEHPEQLIQKFTARQATRLAEFIPKYEALQRHIQDKEWREDKGIFLPPGYMHHTKVAVIDTGVDPGSVKCFGISGASFIPSGPGGGESPWWYSQELHGTQVARIITELDPSCELLVAKVGDEEGDMTTERVTKAFEWATRSGADIISVSAAVKKDERLKAQVAKTIAKGILVLGSAAGEGRNNTEACPADLESVVSIAAASLDGKTARGSVKEAAEYMFTGEDLVVSTSFLGSEPHSAVVEGTSFATAIAAGVASLLLACRRLALSTQRLRQPWLDHAQNRREFVKRKFDEMKHSRDKHYVKPWKVFKQEDNQLSWGEAQDMLTWIQGRFLRQD